MDPRLQRIEAAFNQAIDQPSREARDAFVEGFCGADAGLRERLRELLFAYDSADEFLEKTPVVDRTPRPDDPGVAAELARLKPEQAGERIGPYRLVEQIGEGGFGVVWVAEQERPVRRRVALKIIKLGMDTQEVMVRFEQERQALALMEHPNIARVLDAGATRFGRPFFAMELVRGIRITDHCDRGNLPIQERLKLVIEVCHAVQHAHQKGIIHRDLKPSNILVTQGDGPADAGVPKVIDFGVAKATRQHQLTDPTIHTRFDQVIGTPLYMSPEQVERDGSDLDTRSDIYSLGVLLYELLAGRTPFDPQEFLKAGYDEMRRVIREREPQRPSTFLSTLGADVRTKLARCRRLDGVKLISTLRGDLDWIVMKALEKDRTRRYETANELAMDLQRHLDDEPVLARPASRLYRFQRLARRNKFSVSAAVAVAAALVVGLTASVWQAARAEHQATRARSEAERAVTAERRTRAVLEDLRATAPAFAELARTLVAREQFDGAIDKLDYALKLRPDSAEYLGAKADLLQCQLRLAEAAAAYRAVLVLAPDDLRAKSNAALCDRLLAASADPRALARENLGELFVAMQTEHRSAAELMRVGRLLNEEKKVLLAYWLERLKTLPIPPETPLENRLTMRSDGLLALDLSETKITDLRPLAGMPLGVLNCDECVGIEELGPLHGMPLKELSVRRTHLSDLSPLMSLSGLERLYATGTKITNLAALHGLPLKELSIGGTGVADLAPLRGMPLEVLAIEYLPINDLSALSETKLRKLFATAVLAKDLSPLADLPLETLSIQDAPYVRDLGFLLKMPLRELSLHGCDQSSGFSVLSRLPTLEVLVLPIGSPNLPEAEYAAISALRTHPGIRQLDSVRPSGPGSLKLVRPKDRFWREWDRQARFLGPLRKAGGRVTLDRTFPDGTWSVTIQDQAVSDLTCLTGAPISVLVLSNTKVADLTPLEGMPLRFLSVQNGKVTDVRPLIGLPLTSLFLDGGAAGMNVGVLAEIPTLERITLPPDPLNLEALRNLPKLKYLSFEFDGTEQLPSMSSAQFWKQPLSAEKLAEEGRFAEAADSLEERLREGRSLDERMVWFLLAAVEVAGRDHPRYRATCAAMVKRFKDTGVVNEADSTAKVCLLAPDSGVAAADIAAIIESARGLEGDADLRHWFFLTSGLNEYRAGHWARAAEQLNRMDIPWPPSKAAASVLFAMIRHQQNDREGARAGLQEARQQILPQWRGKAGDPDWLVARLLLQEAEKLIGGPALEMGVK